MSNILFPFSFFKSPNFHPIFSKKQLPDLDFDLSLVAFSKLIFTSEMWGKIKSNKIK